MELGHGDGKLHVHYDDRLVTLIREVRQLTGMGYVIPAKIQHTANTGQKFYKQAVILKQVMTLYFSLLFLILKTSQYIPSMAIYCHGNSLQATMCCMETIANSLLIFAATLFLVSRFLKTTRFVQD